MTDKSIFDPDDPYLKKDKKLYAFLEELSQTNGRMYQNRDRQQTREPGMLPPMRPQYYGRKPSNSLPRMRARRVMTQEELAAKTGTTRRTIIAIENTRRQPSVYLALAIAQALDMKVEDIFHLPHLTPVPPSKY